MPLRDGLVTNPTNYERLTNMYHHDSRDYNVAVSEAAKKGREKMEQIISQGAANAEAVVEAVHSQLIEDALVPAKLLKFYPTDQRSLAIELKENEYRFLHKHALGQAADRANIAQSYVKRLLDVEQTWGQELLAYNFNKIYSEGNGARYLVRSVGNECRGFVSDRFRRLDARPLLDAFVQECQALGALPIDGFALETKVKLRAVLPYVFEPLDNEVMLFGLEWGTSDFGDGGHTVSLWAMRVWCTNTAVMDEVLRQVHIGGRISDDVEYSEKTYRLDTELHESKLRDIVRHTIGPERVNSYLQAIKNAGENEIKSKDALAVLKRKLTPIEAEEAITVFDSNDTQNLPAGENRLRLSNAVSWIAQAKGRTQERRLELERFAGDLIPREAVKAVEVG